MITKSITYEDYNGITRTEDFSFNLTTTEIFHMNKDVPGGMAQAIRRIVKANDGNIIMDEFENFIKASYGVKTPDGRGFKKTPEILQEFLQSPAYDALYMELITDAKVAAEFIAGIVPKKMAEKMAEVQDKVGDDPEKMLEYIEKTEQ